jgi:hypothetical protein
MRIRRSFPLLLMLAAACSDAAGPGAGAVRLTTLVNGDALPNDENVTVTIENRGSRAVFISRCGEYPMMVVQRREGGEWENYSGDACIGSFSPPLELAPGASASTSRAVREPGRYRVRLDPWYPDEPESPRRVVSEGFDIP